MESVTKSLDPNEQPFITVLVVCSHRIMQASLCEMLERQNFKTTTDLAQADVVVIDLSQVSPPYPLPYLHVPNLALVKGLELEIKVLLSNGYHGYLHQDSEPPLLFKALRAIAKGEFWVERKVIADLFEQDKNSKLTRRELEVQSLLEQGLSNQHIADHLGRFGKYG